MLRVYKQIDKYHANTVTYTRDRDAKGILVQQLNAAFCRQHHQHDSSEIEVDSWATANPKNTSKEVEVERIIITRNCYRVAPRCCSWLASASIVNLWRTPDADANFSSRSDSRCSRGTACAMHVGNRPDCCLLISCLLIPSFYGLYSRFCLSAAASVRRTVPTYIRVPGRARRVTCARVFADPQQSRQSRSPVLRGLATAQCVRQCRPAQPIPPLGSSQPELRRQALHRSFPPSLLPATVAQTHRQPRTHLSSSRVGRGQGIR